MRRTKPALLACLLLVMAVCQFVVAQSGEDNQAASDLSLEQKAANGDPEAQNQMGLDANDARRYDEAFKWFQLAAKQGLSKAQLSVGYAYDEGLGVKKDQVEAVHWYALAAAQGNAQAEFNLGMCYHHGEGVASDDAAQNRSAAIKWFSLALSHGNEGAANGLGLVYEHSPSPDYTEAFRWYKKGAEMGDAEAAYNTCRLMAQGLGSPSDYSEALHWCSEAADGDNKFTRSWGQYGLGRIHEDGTGVPRDYVKAAEWYRKSAEQGNPASQLRLGDLYSKGKGVNVDLVEAYMWIAVAGSLGNPEALTELQILTPKMRENEVLKGQTRARQWIEQHRRDPEDDPGHNVTYPH
jgi:hypothetical protein